jgi:hypothetical protein
MAWIRGRWCFVPIRVHELSVTISKIGCDVCIVTCQRKCNYARFIRHARRHQKRSIWYILAYQTGRTSHQATMPRSSSCDLVGSIITPSVLVLWHFLDSDSKVTRSLGIECATYPPTSTPIRKFLEPDMLLRGMQKKQLPRWRANRKDLISGVSSERRKTTALRQHPHLPCKHL